MVAYLDYERMRMAGNYNSRGGGGGKKDFKADPLKGFLLARSVALSYAKDLCVAGRIELEQIPDYTDRMTILQYGQISVDPKVNAEILRIAARVKERADKKPVEQVKVLCDDCVFGPKGTDECAEGDPDFSYDFKDCSNYEDGNGPDMEQHAANERQREQEEAERQAAEDDASDNQTPFFPTRLLRTSVAPAYKCGTCEKTYKTLRGLQKHEEKCNG